MKEDDLGQNDNQHVVRSHIGYLLKVSERAKRASLLEDENIRDDDGSWLQTAPDGSRRLHPLLS